LKIVLDTNVMVSALLRPDSIPGRIVDLVLAEQVMLALDHRIFAEYQAVLFRPEFPFSPDQVGALLEFVWRAGEMVDATALPIHLLDPDDVMFIEVAVSALASALVTGNLKHFPASQRQGVRVLAPREWLETWAG
jgi:putative PIN family toxin of toxin-antitoxin system